MGFAPWGFLGHGHQSATRHSSDKTTQKHGHSTETRSLHRNLDDSVGTGQDKTGTRQELEPGTRRPGTDKEIQGTASRKRPRTEPGGTRISD